MAYALLDLELTEPLPPLRLRPDQHGFGAVLREHGHVVGYALAELPAGAELAPAELAPLLEGERVRPAVLEPPPGPAPEVAVVVCTRGRPELLRQCLAAVVAQVDPGAVLVVDNAPEDDATRAVAAELGVGYVVEPVPGLDVARNRALRRSRADVLAFLDDDVVPDRHWYARLLDVWRRHPDAGGVTGQILPAELDTDAQVAFERRGGFRGAFEEIRWDAPDLPDNPVYPYAPGMFGAGANFSIRREVVLALGAFDEALDTGPPLPGGGDIDMMHRLVRHGHPLVYDPRVVVFHRHRRDDEGLRRQYDSWGRSLMAFGTKTYRHDPAGRPKLRRMARWFFRAQLDGVRSGDPALRDASLAELRGGTAGLLGTYARSTLRMRRRRRDHRRPVVAILPWGDVVEDYTVPIGLTLDDYVERLSGGWLFGFVEALDRADVDAVVVCWSSEVRRPTRRLHVPTGAPIWFVPASRAYRAARALVPRPYAWSRAEAFGERPAGTRVTRHAARLLLPYLTATPLRLARVLRAEDCTAVLTQEYEEGRFDVCVALGRLLRLPVFATFQGGDRTRTRLEQLVRHRSVRASAGLVIAAPLEQERVRERYGVPPDRILPAANPLDPATLPLRPKAEARAELGLPPDARVVAWHGRVDRVPKGIDVLLDTWCALRQGREGRLALLLLGTGASAGWLHERIAELGLDDVRWRDEYVVDRTVVGTHLAAADVYVLPSRQEGFPVALVEAMAAGLPVVATDAPGVHAIVGDEGAGVVVPREDVAALAGALRHLLDDDEAARATGRRARERVEATFSLEAVGAQLRSFLVEGRR